jgi:hypothetical protein
MNYLLLKKVAARKDIFRLIGVVIIAVASIICIALDKDRPYFTNILTFVIGILFDSPLSERKGPFNNPSSV